VVAVGGLVVGFVIGAAVASPAEPGEQAVTVTSVSPSAAGKVVAAPKRTAQAVKLAALIADFDRNQLSAEKKWGDKSVVVTGVIDNISEDVLGKPYLSFENPSDEITLTSVACYLKNVADAEKLANGETRTVQGVVDEDQSLGVIALNDCVVVK
jgi:long-subunit fatty acid transport protein